MELQFKVKSCQTSSLATVDKHSLKQRQAASHEMRTCTSPPTPPLRDHWWSDKALKGLFRRMEKQTTFDAMCEIDFRQLRWFLVCRASQTEGTASAAGTCACHGSGLCVNNFQCLVVLRLLVAEGQSFAKHVKSLTSLKK